MESHAHFPNVGESVPNSYIIIFKSNLSEQNIQAHFRIVETASAGSERSLSLDHHYNFGTLKGYCGTFDSATIGHIASQADVAYIEPNYIVTPQGDDVQASENRDGLSTTDTVSWGLSAISHRTRKGPDTSYIYDKHAGSDITTYVIDTGIRVSHQDFEGRAKWGKNFTKNSKDEDTHGHGTHVAGTIAGVTYGVAKKSTVVALKVIGDKGKGETADTIKALEWVVQNAVPGKSVVNMSIGTSLSQAINDAVKHTVDKGIPCVVAAGNKNRDASEFSPASAPSAITVGNVQKNTYRAKNSNYGTCLAVFAPGSGILSCWNASDTATKVLSGTSMASPHVAGVVACLMRHENIKDPIVIRARLKALATPSIVSNPGPGSPHLFLHNGTGIA